jgi:hypothetical protein
VADCGATLGGERMSPMMGNLLVFGVVFWGIVGVICWMLVKAFR